MNTALCLTSNNTIGWCTWCLNLWTNSREWNYHFDWDIPLLPIPILLVCQWMERDSPFRNEYEPQANSILQFYQGITQSTMVEVCKIKVDNMMSTVIWILYPQAQQSKCIDDMYSHVYHKHMGVRDKPHQETECPNILKLALFNSFEQTDGFWRKI